MITSVTIAYRLPGREVETLTHRVSAKSEAVAFDAAVEELKTDLLVRAGKQWLVNDPVAHRIIVRAIVQLRPWCESYQY